MARDKRIRVVIDGEEYVSKAADDAAAGMDRFEGKKGRWIKSFVDLRAAFDTIVQVGRALAGVAMESLAAFDEYSASMRRLEGTAKITGTPLETLTDLAGQAKREFGLSSVQANAYATAVNNLASKAGYAGDKQELLAAMLDLGAAKGLTAAESLQAFEQSILGIDEGTDKLFGKNPSGLWADYAEQIGKAPGKMSDLDKSLVLIYATMEAGGKVQGSYSEWLQSSAGQTALLTNRLNDAKVSFGEILSPIRAVVVEGMNTFMDSLGSGQESLGQIKAALTLVAQNLMGTFLTAWKTMGPAVVFALKAAVAGVMLFTDAVQMLQIIVQEVVGYVAQRLGGFAEKTAGVFRALGMDVKAEWGTTLRQWGEGLDRGASETYAKFRRTSEAAWASVTRDAVEGGQRTASSLSSVGSAATVAGAQVTQGTAQAGEAIKRNLGPATADLVKLTELAMVDLKATATETLAPRRAEEFTGAMDVLTRKLHEAKAATQAMQPPLQVNTERARDLSREVGTIARGALDLAQAFGVVDSQAAGVLNSVVSIATALPRALSGDLTSIGGIIGGVANIAKQIVGGDTERKRLLSLNTEALRRLSRDVGGLKLNVTGDDFVKAQSALQGVVGQLRGGRGAANEDDVRTALMGVGLTMTDLERIGKEFGITLRTQSGALNVDSISALLQALGRTQVGRLGQSFDDQLEFFRQSQEITGQSKTASGLQGLLDFLVNAGGVTALQGFDLSAPDARQRLFELFTSLNNQGVAAADLGRLTGSQFRDLLLELIGGIDGLGTTPPSAAPAPVDGGEALPPIGAPPTPAATLADVFKDYGSQSLPLLTAQLEVQRGILAATQATAENTGVSASRLDAILGFLERSGGVDFIDRILADRRRDAEINAGRGIVL